MTMKIRESEGIARLSLVDVRAYLISQGWQATGRYGIVATIFEKEANGRKYEILLPLKEELGDFSSRMRDIVAILSEVEQRHSSGVYIDLLKSGFDIVRLRAPNSDETGTIEFEHGVALYQQARNMIAAAANAAVKTRGVFGGNSPDRVKDYVSTLRLGQTEVGSYVLTVLSPVPPALKSEQLQMFPEIATDEVPFSRSVTRMLDHSLSVAKQAVSEASATGSLNPFDNAIADGDSANH